jgi:hypothetical protein
MHFATNAAVENTISCVNTLADFWLEKISTKTIKIIFNLNCHLKTSGQEPHLIWSPAKVRRVES